MRIIWTILCAGLLTACGGGGEEGFVEYHQNETTFTSHSLLMIERDTHVRIPAGSRGLKFHYKPPIDPSFEAKIEIPNTAETSVTQQIARIKPPDFDYHKDEESLKKLVWWNPSNPVIQRIQVAGADRLYVALCWEDGRLILYISHWMI